MEFAGKKKLHIIIGIGITALFTIFLYTELFEPDFAVAGFIRNVLPFELLEAKLLDLRFRIRGPLKPPDNVVIAAIDEESIRRLGGFPWSRDKIAALVRKITDYGAELIMFDVILSESKEDDRQLALAIRDAGNVILPVSFSFDSVVKISHGAVGASTALPPLDELAAEAMAVGHINMLADRDGTLRWEAAAIEHDGNVALSIDLLTAALFLGVPPEAIDINSDKGIRLGRKKTIPLNKNGQFLINHYGKANTFRHISIADIVDGKTPKTVLQGSIVLIGATTAKGLFDLRVTPFTAEMPGIEKHASVISSVIENRLLRKASPYTDLGILLVSGIAFSILIVRFSSLGASIITAAGLLIIFASGHQLFALKNIWLNISYPLLNMLSVFVAVTAYNYAVEERYARSIRAMFSNYSTEKLVDALIKNPELARLGGERREITVLFSDVRGFTSFSEKYEPEQVVAMLNEYLGKMASIVLKWGGTLDKFIGDAILVFWNAPSYQENHPELAVKCALDMIRELTELQSNWQTEGKDALDIGIGINTGEVIVGNIGAEGKKMDYTVIGDHVNLSSRVESLTKKYGCHILITEFTANKIREAILKDKIGHVALQGLEKVIVKGKKEPVGIYEIKSLDEGSKSLMTDCDENSVVKMHEK
ncbi:MAG: adenylate/guanylate cyclase domain-containing protein [Nitrospirae bacterium]|nr:adenylate/guanylate cyclase domain-containing protein [Nitrospirota bacterium]